MKALRSFSLWYPIILSKLRDKINGNNDDEDGDDDETVRQIVAGTSICVLHKFSFFLSLYLKLESKTKFSPSLFPLISLPSYILFSLPLILIPFGQRIYLKEFRSLSVFFYNVNVYIYIYIH